MAQKILTHVRRPPMANFYLVYHDEGVDGKTKFVWIGTWSEEDDNFHADIFVVVDLEPAKLFGEVQHFVHALIDAEVSGRGQAEGLFIGDPDQTRRVDGSVAAREHQQLAPSVDQQCDLVVDL